MKGEVGRGKFEGWSHCCLLFILLMMLVKSRAKREGSVIRMRGPEQVGRGDSVSQKRIDFRGEAS